MAKKSLRLRQILASEGISLREASPLSVVLMSLKEGEKHLDHALPMLIQANARATKLGPPSPRLVEMINTLRMWRDENWLEEIEDQLTGP